MHLKRENKGRNTIYLYAVLMTLVLVALLLVQFVTYDRKRTLHTALAKTDGAPLSFSADSGFYEAPFLLKIKAGQTIPQDGSIEIHYTTNGDEPTENSPLYKEGIDLKEVIRQLEKEATSDAEGTSSTPEATSDAEGTSSTPEATSDAEGASSTAEASSDAEGASSKADTSSDKTGASSAEEDPYSIESQRKQWEEEKNALVSEKGVYAEPAEDGIHVIPVRACLIQGEDKSSVVTRTYVIGPGVFERYDAYVACISTDSYNLFDYDNGIMVRGSNYQKDIEEGKRQDRSGNYYHEGEKWIKDGHVTLFSPEGEVLLEEDAGISVGGFSSRGLPTKSLKAEALTSRGSSDEWFHLDMFETGSYSRAGNLPIINTEAKTVAPGEDPVDFRRIRFRTHGTPQIHIRSVRNEYARRITDACGFPGLPEARLGVTYLNGEFYTACDIMPSVTKDYMCTLFGLNTPDAIEKYDSSDYDIYTRTKILRLFNADLTQEENQKALEEAVDMDNYLFYFALEVLFNNSDWPFNNVTMWRYIGEYDPDNLYTDGRYRFILDDMDQILTNDLHSAPEHWSTEVVDYLMRDEGNTFYHVMQCKEYRDTFLTIIDDLLQTAFEPEYACAVLDALYADIKREYIFDYGEAFWAEMEDTAETTKKNVREKEDMYRADITKYMGLTDRYSVQIEAGEGVSVSWNNMTVPAGGTWANEYYCGTSFTVTAQPGEGYRFAGWEINGIDGINGEPAGTPDETLTISDDLSFLSETVNADDTKAADGSKGKIPELKVRAIAEPVRESGGK